MDGNNKTRVQRRALRPKGICSAAEIAKAALLALFLILPQIGHAETHPAGAQFDFGDSLLDVNYTCHVAFFNSPVGACSNFRNTPIQLASLTPYAFDPARDYAVGASAGGPGTIVQPGLGLFVAPPFPGYAPPLYPNMFGQIAAFAASGARIGPNDLVFISGGNNDTSVYAPAAGAPLALAVVGYLKADTSAVIRLGARHIMLMVGGDLADPAYHATLTSLIAPALAPLASGAEQIRLFDLYGTLQRVLSDPLRYGFVLGDCLFIPGCSTAPLSLQNLFPAYGGHPSDSGSLVLARYIANLLGSADGIAAEADLGQIVAGNLNGTLLRNLEADHLKLAPSMRLASPSSAWELPAAQGSAPLSDRMALFLAATYEGGSREDRPNASGFGYESTGILLGGKYRLSQEALFGLALDYNRTNSSLHEGRGDLEVDSYAVAGFASFSYPHLFVDLVVSGGYHSYAASRPGVFDELTARPTGYSVGPSVLAGYLFDVSPIQIGPLLGLSYSHTHIRGYTESGDPILAQSVEHNDADSLTGDAGIQIRHMAHTPSCAIGMFLNLAAEHGFLSDARTITTVNVDPVEAIPVYTALLNERDTYGTVAGGIEAALAGRLSIKIEAQGTFARASGNDYAVSASANLRF